MPPILTYPLRSLLCRLCLLVLSATTLFAIGAEPQGHAERDADLLWSPLTRREVEHYAAMLRVDREQAQTIRTLFHGYRSEVLATITIADAKCPAPKPGEPKSAGRHLKRFEAAYFLLDETDRLSAAFFRDLEGVLTPEQAAALPAVMRARRRHVGSRLCVCGMERVDLIKVATSLGLERTPDLDAALAGYEERVNRLMIEKSRRVRRLFEELAQAELEARNQDPRLLGRVIRDLTKGSVTVRDVVARQSQIIQATLNERDAKRWKQEINRLAYPRVYASNATSDAYAQIRKVSTLTKAQVERLDEIAARYEREAEELAPAYVRAINHWQEQMAANDSLEVLEAANKLDEHEPLERSRRLRDQLARSTVGQMFALLTPEQKLTFKDPPTAERIELNEDLFPIEDGHSEQRRDWDQAED